MSKYFILILLASFGTCAASGKTVVVKGSHGYEGMRIRDLKSGSTVDLQEATFRVVNSRNDSPRKGRTCRSGDGYVNRYPLAVENSPHVTVLGGRFDGEVPQESDWVYTYCNSAAVRVERSVSPRIEGQRIRGAWDAIRIDDDSDDFVISGVWISENRDDCVENDHLASGEITDSLMEGCFSGISVAPTFDTRKKAHVTLDGLLIRMEDYPYKDDVRHALPIKIEGWNAKLDIRNSVIAMETRDLIGGKHIEKMWRSVNKCSNNLLLWISDHPIPRALKKRPRCFRIASGDKAKELWYRAKRNWIDCHSGIARFEDDRASEPGRCRTDQYGGFSLDD